VLRDGRLESIRPPFLSLEDYRSFFFDPARWAIYLDWLKQNDRYFDRMLFRKTVLDKSSIVRMIRRAYAYSSRRKKEARVYDEREGFNPASEEVKVLQAIISDFAESARRDGSLPIVYIVNNLFTGSRLYDLIKENLLQNRIPYLSSHEICAPDDPGNYLPDTHFIPSKNLELARAMIELIHENLDRSVSEIREAP